MVNLEGNLNAANMEKVLQVLIKKNPASTWLISDGRDEKVIYFSTGGVRLYSSEGRSIGAIEDYLRKQGLVSPDDLSLAQMEVEKNPREGLIGILERMELLPRKRFLKVVEELIFLEICDVVTWENAIFEFYSGNPPPEIFDQEHPALFAGLDVKELAERIRQWSQEWGTLRGKLYSERLVPSLLVGPDELESVADGTSQAQRLFRCINGQRNLRQLSRFSGAAFPTVARTIRETMQEGYVRCTLVPEKNPTTSEEVLDEIEKLEAALDKAINTILIHKRIATSYETINENDSASEQYQAVGNIHTRAGQLPKAVDNYRRAITLSPQNLAAHKSLIRRLQELGEDEKALDEIVGMSRKMASFGLLQQASDALKGIVRKVKHRFDIRILFADLLVRLGNVTEGIAEYLGVIQDKKRIGAVEGIEELYLKVLALDPVNQEARAGLRQERKRHIQKKVIWIHWLSAAAAAVIVGLWVSVEALARVRWKEMQPAIEQAVARGDHRKGFEELRSFSGRYPANLLGASLLSFEENLHRDLFHRIEEQLSQADALYREGEISRAKKILVDVEENGLLDSQVRRARQGIEKVIAIREKWLPVRQKAERLLKSRQHERAFFLCRKVIENYEEGAEGMEVPFLIQSNPPSAVVKVAGVPEGVTPLWVTLRHARERKVILERPDYRPLIIGGFDERDSPYLTVTLEKEK